MLGKSPIRYAAVTAIALALGGLQGTAGAAACKGLEKNKCESSSSCTWVDSYTRKDGVKVDGYCRAKGGKKSSSKSDS